MAESDHDDDLPIASEAAWSPQATPPPQPSRVLTLDGFVATTSEDAEPEPAPEPPAAHAAPRPDRLSTLRDVARRLRTAPDAEETLQYVIEVSCACTGSDAGMLTLAAPESRQVVAGTALGAGPYISVQLRAGGPSFGEIVLTRMADAPEFSSEDETFAELVAEYIAKAVGGLRRGSVITDEQQDFIDRVTEELRAPLAGAVNLLAAVNGGQAGPQEARGYLTSAARDTARMLGLLDDLIHIARLRPPEPREMESIPVGPWLRRCVDTAMPLATDAGHKLILRIGDQPWIVKGVPAQLDLVIKHLLDNAIKFTTEPGTIELTAMISEGMLRVSVADPGIGFDAADANRMTDCFTRAVNAEAAKIPGAGVGLFLANEIVRQMGGRLWLESRRDEGTQAHLALPTVD
jgi:signal transduction histidine kinase